MSDLTPSAKADDERVVACIFCRGHGTHVRATDATTLHPMVRRYDCIMCLGVGAVLMGAPNAG